MVKTRFAPSPTGIPHVGNIRTALFNYFFARANNGVFILRIEDTDQARKVEGAVKSIKESLKWLEIDWDEYSVQSERLLEYKKYAEELVSKGLAKHEEGAIRFLVPNKGKTVWEDKVGNKRIEFENTEIEDFIIFKKDGFPTYHLANVVDDYVSNITHVIRGEDWISSTPKHILLYKAFGWQLPEFVHVPNIHDSSGKKLSKRRGAKSVLDFKDEGFLSSALLNYLMLLGWSPKNDREILSKDEIIKEFSLGKINVSPAIFDIRKLEWMNGTYIRLASPDELKSKIKNQKSKIVIDDNLLDKFIPLAQTRMVTLNDFSDLVSPFMEKQNIKLTEREKEITQKILQKFSTMEQPARNASPARQSPDGSSRMAEGQHDAGGWSNETILVLLKQILESEKIRMPLVYKILTGKETGLPLSQTLEILGKEKTLQKLKEVL